MTLNLIFGFIFVILVQLTTGFNWVGTFKMNGTCDDTACCCPEPSLTFTDTSAAITSNYKSHGLCNTTVNSVPADATKQELNDTDHGKFTLTNNDTIMEVTLVQNNTNPIPASCKITMLREEPHSITIVTIITTTNTTSSNSVSNTATIDTSTIITSDTGVSNTVTTDNSTSNTATGNTSVTSGNGNGTGSITKGPSGTSSSKSPAGASGATKSTPKTGSDALSNYGSIWIKFLSVIMATILLGLI